MPLKSNTETGIPLPSRIAPWLYIGSFKEANAPAKLLSDLGIVQIINVTHNIDHVHNLKKGETTFKHVRIPVKDVNTTRIDVHFQRVANIIQECMHSTKRATLLHCFEGVSRSVTLGVASMMIIDNVTLQDAMDIMRAARPIIEPNSGFLHQLQQLDTQLYGNPSTVHFTPQQHIARWTTFASTQDDNIALPIDAKIRSRLFEEACQALQETLDDCKTLEECIRYCMEFFATSTEQDLVARDSFAQVLIGLDQEDRTANSHLTKRLESLLKSEDWEDFCLDAPLADKFARRMINQIRPQS
ncbi:phosphatases II [Meira miltonrushii]|uniref:Phosphatases II n=1 Tax=Meira miltonrushii TaxID=1280837 RepID=A0A316VB46_9BASI|nr:phosphatases II [Meira miltonrushii]PWN33443.1 phosphatases II [Meira miltonrushii]